LQTGNKVNRNQEETVQALTLMQKDLFLNVRRPSKKLNPWVKESSEGYINRPTKGFRREAKFRNLKSREKP